TRRSAAGAGPSGIAPIGNAHGTAAATGGADSTGLDKPADQAEFRSATEAGTKRHCEQLAASGRPERADSQSPGSRAHGTSAAACGPGTRAGTSGKRSAGSRPRNAAAGKELALG